MIKSASELLKRNNDTQIIRKNRVHLKKKIFYPKTSPADKQLMRPRATFGQRLSFPGDYQPPQALLILF